jgi:ATP synthase subunit 6
MFSLFSPLEQFEIIVLRPFLLGSIDVSVTNAALYSCIVFLFLSLFFYLAISRPYLLPARWQTVAEGFYVFVLDMVAQQAGKKAYLYFPLFITTFFYILGANLVGLTPFAFTLTSHIIITFTLALAFNLGFAFIGLFFHKLHFFTLFVPKGVPILLTPLIVVIEIVSYLIRTFSLSLRLFANMMAGHTLLQILSSFVIAFLNTKGILILLGLVPFFLVFFVTVLEVGIAFLQAYVFTILLCIYVNDALNLH